MNLYKQKHPDATPREAFREAKKTYVKRGRAPRPSVKKEKSLKKRKLLPKIHKCSICSNFESRFKSNYNRHMRDHADREKLTLSLTSARGTIRKLERAVRTAKVYNGKNPYPDTDRFVSEEQHAENVRLLAEAIKTRDASIALLKMIRDGTIQAYVKSKQQIAQERAQTLFDERKIAQMNKFYPVNYPEEE